MSRDRRATGFRDPTRRFSSSVENYVRYRPGHPAKILDLLRSRCGLTRSRTIAVIGSGTGKQAELFLANGHRGIGIEPNREMREAGKRMLGGYPCFASVGQRRRPLRCLTRAWT